MYFVHWSAVVLDSIFQCVSIASSSSGLAERTYTYVWEALGAFNSTGLNMAFLAIYQSAY